ncbi:MAG: helix-turn-helix domain-containing protein [Pseudomonadota bacterium]
MGRPSRQGQNLRAGRSLFVELGYQGTSIELVVLRAGVSKPTVYNHYPTRQVMLEEMLVGGAGAL